MPSRKPILLPAEQTVSRALDTLLEGFYPPPAALHAEAERGAFTRRHDDTDGKRDLEQELTVMFSPDGDAWIVAGASPSLRFRTDAGGGQSLRVQKALVILAEAIRRDNAERPQQP